MTLKLLLNTQDVYKNIEYISLLDKIREGEISLDGARND